MNPPTTRIEFLADILDGNQKLDGLKHLNRALRAERIGLSPDKTLAIGFDSSVLLNLGKSRMGADVVDYLSQKHTGPIILPAQTLVEFWNNQASGVHALADELRRQFEGLASAVEALDPTYAEFRTGAERLLSGFRDRYGHIMQERIATQLTTLLVALEERAAIPQLPREPFEPIARRRQALRIPPGFKDSGDGDFFVWGEFLLGLVDAVEGGMTIERAILVTDDRKPDWSTKGTAHPSLCAEVDALTGAAFDIWSLKSLSDFVSQSLAGEIADDSPSLSPRTDPATEYVNGWESR